MSLERKIESSIFLCLPRDLNILGKSCTTFVRVKIVRNLSRGRSPCQRVNHVKSSVIYFSAFIYSRIRYYSYVEPGPNTQLDSADDVPPRRSINMTNKKDRETWLKSNCEVLMVTAGVIAAMAYQAGLNPPNGIWQDQTNDHNA